MPSAALGTEASDPPVLIVSVLCLAFYHIYGVGTNQLAYR